MERLIILDHHTELEYCGYMAKIISVPFGAQGCERIGKTCKIIGNLGDVVVGNKTTCLRFGSKLKLLIQEDKKMSTILCVAKLIADTPCKTGVENWRVAQADPEHKLSGLQRLRELAKRFIRSNFYYKMRNEQWCAWAYEYRNGKYFPTKYFKLFIKGFIKQRSS